MRPGDKPGKAPEDPISKEKVPQGLSQGQKKEEKPLNVLELLTVRRDRLKKELEAVNWAMEYLESSSQREVDSLYKVMIEFIRCRVSSPGRVGAELMGIQGTLG